MLRRRMATTAFATATLVLAGSIAFATIPESNETIDACVDRTGQVRLVDTEAGETCRVNEEPIAWNQQGPVGEPGAQGQQGEPGDPGPAATLDTLDGSVCRAGTIHEGTALVAYDQIGLSTISCDAETLTLTVTGGYQITLFVSGTVDGIPIGPRCGAGGDSTSTCTYELRQGAEVTLTQSWRRFSGDRPFYGTWGGACEGADREQPCTFFMNGPQTITAG